MRDSTSPVRNKAGKIELTIFILILLGAGALRLIHLDYSHFQGDEVSALYPLETPFPVSIIEQLKGPVQSLVTLGVRLIVGEYGEWQTRLPFSMASLAGVVIVYLLVKDAFGVRPALLSSALTGSCGLLVSFGRIVQYQAIVMLSVLLTAHFLQRWIRTDRSRYLYFGLIAFAVGVLSHYDAMTFSPALLLLLALGFRSREMWTWGRLRHLLLAGLLAAAIAGLFYIPFIFRPGFSSVTSYLSDRVLGGWVRRTFANTFNLVALYLPPYYLPVIAAFAGLGSIRFFRQGRRLEMLVLLTWFAAPFLFYMFLGGDPRTHIYMYVLPGMILAGLGMDELISFAHHPRTRIVISGLAGIVILLFSSVTYYMIVDHSIEHPWEEKSVLGVTLPNLVSRRISGVFGFPYRRGLEQVGEFFASGELTGSFGSNEKWSTVEFYIDAPRTSAFEGSDELPPDYYIYVHRPYSFRRGLPETVQDTYQLIDSIEQRGQTTIDIYAAPWK